MNNENKTPYGTIDDLPPFPEVVKCIRLDYHDGPCNGYPRVQCAMKNRLEREGKLEKVNSHQQKEHIYINELESTYVRPWYKQIWAWVSGRL